jgi:uncharacterized protein (TIGR02231 family)
MELLMSMEVTISFDILAVISRAVQSAGRIERRGLPAGCQWAWSEDYDYAYVAEIPVDVPSDGDVHSVPLLSRKATPHPLYVVVPRESTDVFRTVRIENPFEAPLLEGTADIYKGGDFLLTSAVKFTPPRAAIDLGLGVEQRIKVSRNTSFREDAAGLIGGSRALDHKINIEVANNTGGAVELEARERIPVAPEGEEEIKVTVKDVSPAWEPFQPFPSAAAAKRLEGGFRWRVRLDAGERKALQAGYQVTIPAKNELIGGNRREV